MVQPPAAASVTDIGMLSVTDKRDWVAESGDPVRVRLRQAALALFREAGYDRTTAAEIAARVGVTERTFFRHYKDKREVLFDGEAILRDALTSSIAPRLGTARHPVPGVPRGRTAAGGQPAVLRTLARGRLPHARVARAGIGQTGRASHRTFGVLAGAGCRDTARRTGRPYRHGRLRPCDRLLAREPAAEPGRATGDGPPGPGGVVANSLPDNPAEAVRPVGANEEKADAVAGLGFWDRLTALPRSHL